MDSHRASLGPTSTEPFRIGRINFDLPIEQVVRRVDTRFQMGFASEARERFAERDAYAFSASRKGLHVLGRNEDALAEPIEMLRRAYGRSVEVGAPAVRLIHGVQIQEPIMHIRICLEGQHVEVVKRLLVERGATAEEQFTRARLAVLRYEAPLARLIGLPAELVRATAGTARYWIVLSHYALVTGDPGGRAA